MKHTIAIVSLILTGLGGCSGPMQNIRSPILYPNAKLQQAGQNQANYDIQECRQLADNYVPSSVAKDTGMGAVLGGLGGAAVGGVIGAIRGNAGRGAGIGGAGGATAGAVRGIGKNIGPNQNYKAYVNTCLAERGYRVIGWQ